MHVIFQTTSWGLKASFPREICGTFQISWHMPQNERFWFFVLFFLNFLILCIILLQQKMKSSKFLLPYKNKQRKWTVVNPYSDMLVRKHTPLICSFLKKKTFHQGIIESVSKWTTVFSLPYEPRSAYKLSEQCKRNCHRPFHATQS